MTDRQLTDMRDRFRTLIDDGGDYAVARAAAAESLAEAIADDQMRRQLRSLVVEFPSEQAIIWSTPAQPPDGDTPASRPTAGAVGRRRPLTILAAAVAAVSIAVVGATLLLPPAPLTALGEISGRVAELSDVPIGDVVLTRTTRQERIAISDIEGLSVPVLQTVWRRDRYDRDGVVQQTERVDGIEVLNETDAPMIGILEAEYGVGTTTVQDFVVPEAEEQLYLSEDPDTLDATIRRNFEAWGDPSTPYGAYLLDRIVSFYTALVPSSRERSAMLAVLDREPAFGQRRTESGVTVSLSHAGPFGVEIRTVTFNENGWLVESSLEFVDGVPADRVPPGTKTRVWMTEPLAQGG